MRLQKRIMPSAAAFFSLLIGFASASKAVPIVWEFGGTITEIDSYRGLPPGIDVGTPFSGSVTFDSGWPSRRHPFGARYEGQGPPYGFDALVGATRYSSAGGGLVDYTVTDDFMLPLCDGGCGGDTLAIHEWTSSPFTPMVGITLSDDAGALLSSATLVTFPPALSALTEASFAVQSWSGYRFGGRIDRLSFAQTGSAPIPEPGAALLFALGSIAVALHLKKTA
jgi:hypothetical protein